MEGVTPPKTSRLDTVLVIAAIAFAFLAASFAATNSDLWLHLATGRLLAAGDYRFGVDPFSWSTEGEYWANHSWLFDLGAYGLFRLAGGAALVAFKAIGIVILAGLQLRIALRSGGPVWLAVATTLLAVLAMSPRLHVQPQCLSLLLLGLCFYLLHTGGTTLRWVPVLICLWVNLDAWFLFGPLLVLLFRIGDWLARSATPQPRWLIPWSLLACLASPHHIHALTLPPELDPNVWSFFPSDPRFTGFFASPWRPTLYGSTGGYSLAAWAFPVLLVSGAVSFLANRQSCRGWRLPVWLVFAFLGAWQARLVPFFAVIGGPILALNLGEVLAARPYLRAGRIAVLFASLALLILAWPGWLQSFYTRDRALAWQVSPDPSLVRVAERIPELRANGVTAKVFNTHPDAAHYIAWFAPGERTHIDSRLALFVPAQVDSRRAAQAIGLLRGSPDVKGLSFLHDDLIVLSDPDRQHLGAALQLLPREPHLFDILDVDGSALLITRSPTPLAKFNADRLAFGGTPWGPPAEGSPLPDLAPWWDLAARRQAARTWEGDAAPVFVRLFEFQTAKERSPALPLLGVRAARAGLAQQPRSDETWVALARAYLNLGRSSWEATAGADLTLLRYLRHVQAVVALHQAAVINPDSLAAHELLAGAFTERRLFDLALAHRREHLRLLKRTSASAESLAAVEEAVGDLERAVFDGENRFAVHTFSLAGNPLDRARIALELGLGGKALDTLLKSHPDLYGLVGLRVLLDLLLQTGQIHEARILLDREELKRKPDALDVLELPGGSKNGRPWRYSLPAYDWFDFCQRAATGDTVHAEVALDRLRDHYLVVEAYSLPQARGMQLRAALFDLATGLDANAPAARFPGQLFGAVWTENIAQTRFLTSVRGDLHLLGALVQLERGATDAADRELQQALTRYGENAAPNAIHPGRPLAVRYREALRQAQ